MVCLFIFKFRVCLFFFWFWYFDKNSFWISSSKWRFFRYFFWIRRDLSLVNIQEKNIISKLILKISSWFFYFSDKKNKLKKWVQKIFSEAELKILLAKFFPSKFWRREFPKEGLWSYPSLFDWDFNKISAFHKKENFISDFVFFETNLCQTRKSS